MNTAIPNLFSPLRDTFEKLAPREQRWVRLLLAILFLALVWWLAIAPALHTWRNSDAAHSKLDAELAQMQQLAAEAKALQTAPHLTAAQAQSWLETSIKQLGKATLSVQTGRVQISFNGASAENLAAWLAEARTVATLRPTEAHWKRQPNDKTTDSTAIWDGVTLLELPR